MDIRLYLAFFTLCSCLCFALGDEGSDSSSTHTYSTKYDNIDLNDLLKNDRLRRNYVNCLLGEGPCTPDAQELKNSIPDAIATDCSKCSDKQRDGSTIVTHYLIDNQPAEWDRLAKIWDKDGEYKQRYLETKKMIGEKEHNTTTDQPED